MTSSVTGIKSSIASKLSTRLSIGAALAALSLSLGGCVTYGQTGVLFTPVGIAGIHKFAPPTKSPDDISEAQRTAERLAKSMD